MLVQNSHDILMRNQPVILQFAEIKSSMSNSKLFFLDSHNDKICSMAWCKDILVSGSRDTTSKIWSKCGEVKHTLGDHTSSVTGVFAIENKIYTLSYDCKLRKWDNQSGKLEHCQYLFSPITYVIAFLMRNKLN